MKCDVESINLHILRYVDPVVAMSMAIDLSFLMSSYTCVMSRYTRRDTIGECAMRRMIAGLMLMGLTFAALAAGPSEVRKRAEASMLVTGWIEVMPDGSVHSYTIDHPEKLPPAVVTLIQNNVPAWKFKVDGNPSEIERARMNVRIVAKRLDDTHDTIAISGTNFDNPFVPGQNPLYKAHRLQPKYPREAIDARVDGTVYLFLRVGRDGTVMNAAVEQVNLDEYASDAEMQHYRSALADSALYAARHWTFSVPTSGPLVNRPFWDVRVPVVYNLVNEASPSPDNSYGKWQAYIPGPRVVIPWRQQNASPPPQGSDAIPAGTLSQADERLHLQTPLNGSAP
jgi:Gram-negative bacterial TonB protein C-terminal